MNQVAAENKKLLSDIVVVKYVNYKLQEQMQKKQANGEQYSRRNNRNIWHTKQHS